MLKDIFKTLLGILIVCGIAFSWVGATQFAQATFSSTFDGAYFNVWFSTTWMLICYPVYMLTTLVYRLVHKKEGYSTGKLINNCQIVFQEDVIVFGPNGLTLLSFFNRIGFFTILWSIANYSYVRALSSIPATDVTAIFSSCSAFVYIFSFIFLGEKLFIFRVLSVCLSISGIVLMANVDGFHGASLVGVLLSFLAAVSAALYKVLFKRIVGDASSGQVSLFLSLLGFFNILFLWPIFFILYYTGFEDIDWYNIPWNYICGSAALGLLFNFLINFGIAFTYPLFISLGTVLGIPINAGVDALWHDQYFGVWKAMAAILIIVGFLLMLIPEPYQIKANNVLLCRSGQNLQFINDKDEERGEQGLLRSTDSLDPK